MSAGRADTEQDSGGELGTKRWRSTSRACGSLARDDRTRTPTAGSSPPALRSYRATPSSCVRHDKHGQDRARRLPRPRSRSSARPVSARSSTPRGRAHVRATRMSPRPARQSRAVSRRRRRASRCSTANAECSATRSPRAGPDRDGNRRAGARAAAEGEAVAIPSPQEGTPDGGGGRAFLASDEAYYVIGSVINTGGGSHATGGLYQVLTSVDGARQHRRARTRA